MADFLKTACVLLLTCLFLVYVKQVFEQYAAGLTTFSLKQSDTGKVPMPAMTICLDPLLKKSVMKEYNTNPAFFEVPKLVTADIPMNESLTDVYAKASYLLGRDWNITIGHYPSGHNRTLTLGN